MAVVKNRLKIFEPEADEMAGIKPQPFAKPATIGLSPALQKFMANQNKVLGEGGTPGTTDTQAKTPPDIQTKTPPGIQSKIPPGTPAKTPPGTQAKTPVDTLTKKPSDTLTKKTSDGVHSYGTRNGISPKPASDPDENKIPPVPPCKNNASNGSSETIKPTDSRRGSKVIVPNIFKDETANVANSSEGRRGSQVQIPVAFKSIKNPVPSPSESTSSDEIKKPKPIAKPGSNYGRPPPGLKPHGSPNSQDKESSSSVSVSKEPVGVKLPAMSEIHLRSTSTSSSLHSGTTSSPASQTLTASDAQDVRNKLRPVKAQTVGGPHGKVMPAVKPLLPPTANRNEESSSDSKPDQSSTCSQPVSSETSTAAARQPPGIPGKLTQDLKRQSHETVERKSDSKCFKKLKFSIYSVSSTPPEKPSLPEHIDLILVKQQYQNALDTFEENACEEPDEIYQDATSEDQVLRKASSQKRESVRISIIPDMTEEEEASSLCYDDGHTPIPPAKAPSPAGDDVYVDAETERKGHPEDDELDQLYEDEEAFALSPEKLEEEKRRRQKEEAEAKKREEKERREREKEEEKRRKKEEKERAKKEKEEMQLRKKFNLTGEETDLGEGVVDQDVKAGMLGGLSLRKGQSVTIIRMNNNPANKWLVRSEAGMGYIDSSIIKVDTASIKQTMASKGRGSITSKGSDGDLYDDVAHDGGHRNDVIEDGEIYEECP